MMMPTRALFRHFVSALSSNKIPVLNNALGGPFHSSSNIHPTLLFYLPSFTPHFDSCSAHSGSASSPQSIKPAIQEFLQKSCGLSQKQAVSASQSLLHLKSTKIPEQVLTFFKERGFSDANILNLVRRRPQVLVSSVQKTLRPKLRVFEELGMVGNELCQVIRKDPAVLRVSLGRKILPGISFLQKILQSNENVVKVLKREPQIVYVDVEKQLKRNFLFLQSNGVNEKLLSSFLIRKPRVFLYTEAVIKDVLDTVRKLGVPCNSGMFPHALFVVSSMAKKTLEHKMKFLMSLGLSEKEVLMAFRKSPSILATSEKNLQIHMDFLVDTLKREPSVIVHYPSFFLTSMEEKIIPRHRVFQLLQSMQLLKRDLNVVNMISMSEKRFLEKFVFKHDKSLGLYEIYKGMDDSISPSHLEVNEGERNDVLSAMN